MTRESECPVTPDRAPVTTSEVADPESNADDRRSSRIRWGHVERVALTPEQVSDYRLLESIGKESDSRKTGFVQRFGKLVQVELDALPPDVLRQLFADAIAEMWDMSAHEAAIERETTERAALQQFARRWEP